MIGVDLTVRSRLSLCQEIRGRLTEGSMNIFRGTPFGPWLDLTMQNVDATLVANFLAREVPDPGAEIEQLTYNINGHVRHFGRADFMLITGLPFGLLPDQNYLLGNQLIRRLFPGSAPARPIPGQVFRVRLSEVRRVWTNEFGRLDDEDKARIALILMVEFVFLGTQAKAFVSDEVIRAVDDFPGFSEYPWGSFIWTRTYKCMKGAFSRRTEIGNKMSCPGFLPAFNVS